MPAGSLIVLLAFEKLCAVPSSLLPASFTAARDSNFGDELTVTIGAK